MASCDQCGAEVTPGEEFCPRCGAGLGSATAAPPVGPVSSTGSAPPTLPAPLPAPSVQPATTGRPTASKMLPIAVAALVVAVGVIGWLLVAKPSGAPAAGSSGNSVAAPPTYRTAQGADPATTTSSGGHSGPATTTRAATSTSVPTPTAPPIDPETAAQQQIQQIVAADRAQVGGILGQWVPQLSSKQVGLADPEDPWYPGQPYTNQMILQAYKNYQQQYPSAVLISSSDYPSFTFPGYWVVVLEMPFSSQDEALGWCDARGISRNNCIGTKIHN